MSLLLTKEGLIIIIYSVHKKQKINIISYAYHMLPSEPN